MATRKIAPSPRPTKRGADRSAIIGFAYGTFDLLHDGHRHFLRAARAQCDQLIVAIDSDRFARERKGPGRPVEDEAVRSQSLVASGLVHLVLCVDDRRQLNDAVAYYEPDILFAAHNSPARALEDDGKRPAIVTIPLLEGHSTSAAIKARLQ